MDTEYLVQLIENKGLEILIALSKQPDGVSDESKKWACKTLERLVEWGLIKPTEAQPNESTPAQAKESTSAQTNEGTSAQPKVSISEQNHS